MGSCLTTLGGGKWRYVGSHYHSLGVAGAIFFLLVDARFQSSDVQMFASFFGLGASLGDSRLEHGPPLVFQTGTSLLCIGGHSVGVCWHVPSVESIRHAQI